jgi:hypothetical protein
VFNRARGLFDRLNQALRAKDDDLDFDYGPTGSPAPVNRGAAPPVMAATGWNQAGSGSLGKPSGPLATSPFSGSPIARRSPNPLSTEPEFQQGSFGAVQGAQIAPDAAVNFAGGVGAVAPAPTNVSARQPAFAAAQDIEIPKATLRLDEPVAARMGAVPGLPDVTSAPDIAVSVKPAATALLDNLPAPAPRAAAPASTGSVPAAPWLDAPSATTAPATPPVASRLPLTEPAAAPAPGPLRMSAPPPPMKLPQRQGATPAPGPTSAPAPAPAAAKGGGVLDWMGRGFASEPAGKGWDIDGWVAKQSGDARIAAERMAPLLKAGATVGQAAASLAIPAAVIAPALAAGLGAGDQFGEAGGALAAGASGLGGLAGAGAGWAIGNQVPYGGGRGARLVGALLGGLAGSGIGAGGAQVVNTGAQGLVDRANAGRGGVAGTVGSALDALGYQGSNDAIREQMAAMEMNPAVQLLRQQERARKAEEQNALVQQIYLQSLARGGS